MTKWNPEAAGFTPTSDDNADMTRVNCEDSSSMSSNHEAPNAPENSPVGATVPVDDKAAGTPVSPVASGISLSNDEATVGRLNPLAASFNPSNDETTVAPMNPRAASFMTAAQRAHDCRPECWCDKFAADYVDQHNRLLAWLDAMNRQRGRRIKLRCTRHVTPCRNFQFQMEIASSDAYTLPIIDRVHKFEVDLQPSFGNTVSPLFSSAAKLDWAVQTIEWIHEFRPEVLCPCKVREDRGSNDDSDDNDDENEPSGAPRNDAEASCMCRQIDRPDTPEDLLFLKKDAKNWLAVRQMLGAVRLSYRRNVPSNEFPCKTMPLNSTEDQTERVRRWVGSSSSDESEVVSTVRRQSWTAATLPALSTTPRQPWPIRRVRSCPQSLWSNK